MRVVRALTRVPRMLRVGLLQGRARGAIAVGGGSTRYQEREARVERERERDARVERKREMEASI